MKLSFQEHQDRLAIGARALRKALAKGPLTLNQAKLAVCQAAGRSAGSDFENLLCAEDIVLVTQLGHPALPVLVELEPPGKTYY